RNRHWNKKSAQVRAAAGELPFGEKYGYGKVGVIGAIARKGNVVCKVIGDTDAETLSGFVRNVVSDKVSLVATDEKEDYNYVDRRMKHAAIKHSAGEYVRGEVHTNNIESFWSLLKRSIKGTYVSVEPYHLFRYLDEQAFRYNERHDTDAQRFQKVLG